MHADDCPLLTLEEMQHPGAFRGHTCNPAPALNPPVNFTSTVSRSPPGLLSHLPLFFDKKPSVSSSSPSCLSQSADTHSLSPTSLPSLHATDAPLMRLLSLCSERSLQLHPASRLYLSSLTASSCSSSGCLTCVEGDGCSAASLKVALSSGEERPG